MKKTKRLFQPNFNNYVEYWVFVLNGHYVFYEKEIANMVAKCKGGYVVEKHIKQLSM